MMLSKIKLAVLLCFVLISAPVSIAAQNSYDNPQGSVGYGLGFGVPSIGQFIGIGIAFIFVLAGLMGLANMLIGAFELIISGGDDKKVKQAQGKILHAVIGLVMMVAVLSLAVFLEQVIFGGKICMGISCAIRVKDLILLK